ncbi:hypothetical protein M3Y97_00617400 [Aphelenchoides bicaudatus]|nr:hypothetical protein M3Y97_00617400 [Aphelenchoides bicaudatus]
MDSATALNSTLKQFRVLFPRQFPAANPDCGHFPHFHQTKTCEFPGLFVEIIKLIAKFMNAELVVRTLTTKDDEYSTGIIESNRTTGLLGFVSDDTVDTLAYPLQKTTSREIIFNFSDTLYYVESNILHKRRDDKLNFLWAFFTIYDSVSWSFMGAILILETLFYIAHQYCQDSMRYSFDEITDSLWEAIQLHLGQSRPIARKIYAVKFNVIIVHFFHYILLLGVYSSWLFSKKVIVNKTERLEGFPEMIKALERGNRFFVSTTDKSGIDWFYETVRDSNVYPFKNIRETLHKNPIVVTNSKRKTLATVSGSTGMALVMEDDESNYIARSFCGLVTMSEPVSVSSAHLIFNKDSKWIEPVNEAIRNNTIRILAIFKKYKDYMKRISPPNCDEGVIKVNNHVVLPYYGLMIAWGGCIIVSTFTFVIEFCLFYIIRSWRRRHGRRKQAIIPTPTE